MKNNIRNFTLAELVTEFEALSEPAYRARQVFAWLYKKGAATFAEMRNVPAGLRAVLETRFSINGLSVSGESRAGDGTVKYLFALSGGKCVETVLIPEGDRNTVCVSTQVGCRFRCGFCASGMRGFGRNLEASEIMGQILFVRFSRKMPVHNVVFMGMGEPFDNFENLVRALDILNDPGGFGLAARRITVSTSGIVPGILRFAKIGKQFRLSVSLHAADNDLRNRLMPVNRKYPLPELLDACRRYQAETGRRITFEYILIGDVNDSPDDAEHLADIAAELKANINLIPYSRIPGLAFRTPAESVTARFARQLADRKVNAVVRRSRGADIEAACGQLAMKTRSSGFRMPDSG